MFVSSCHFMSRRMPLLCLLLCLTGYRSWCRYVTRWWWSVSPPDTAAASLSLGCSSVSLSALPSPVLWSVQIRFVVATQSNTCWLQDLNLKYLIWKQNNEYMFTELCDSIIDKTLNLNCIFKIMTQNSGNSLSDACKVWLGLSSVMHVLGEQIR